MKPHFSMVPLEKITSNKANYIRNYEEDDIEGLASSIRKFGLIEPLIVRKKNLGYIVICGERRLRACKKARLLKVPVIITNCTQFQSNTMNFNNNYHVREMNYLEKFKAIKSYMDNWGLTNEECSEVLNINIFDLEDILELNKLTSKQLEIITLSELSRDQVHISLKIASNDEREKFLQYISSRKLNFAQTKALYNKIVSNKKGGNKGSVTPDLRLILNSLNRAVEMIKQSGINVNYTKTDNDTSIECFLTIQKPVFQMEDH